MRTTGDLQRLLREEVGRFRQREQRRRFDAAVYVGRLGGARDSFVVRAMDRPVVDAALRVDVLSALLAHGQPDWQTAWLMRPGLPEPHDEDLAWFSAARRAFAVHDRTLAGFYAITRYGWRDVVTGESRTWKRLRL
jgi:hypothetical protein